jgi:hypothetical protein
MPGTFLPTTLNDWLGLVLASVAILGGGWGLAIKTIRAPLEAVMKADRERNLDSFRAQGERIGDTESDLDRSGARIEAIDRAQERTHLEVVAAREQYGRLEAKLGEILSLLDQRKDIRHAEHMQVTERLIRIETLMGVGKLPANGG